MEKKQTAVEWLWDMLLKAEFINDPEELFDKVKQMEKDQIIEAAERWKGTNFAEQYYNETYGSNLQ